MTVESVLIAAGIAALLNGNPTSVTYYPSCGIVTSLETETDSVIYEDPSGNIWDFKGIEDWAVNDVVALIMSDNGTPNYVYDDEPISWRYCGYFER